MRKIAFFDAKPYDHQWFDLLGRGYEFIYYENRLTPQTAPLAQDCDGICAFVNDSIDSTVIDTLYRLGVRVIAMRCAGYSNVDFKAAYRKINIVRVPAYSPYAVAEHALALLLTLNRKLHKAYNRTRDFNFSIAGLTGTDLHGKTAGIIGTGRIGRVFIEACKGLGMNIVAYDAYPLQNSDIHYVPLDVLFTQSDVISLHCPLNEGTRHILNADAFARMKRGVYIINTSRGALIESSALLEALNDGIVRGAGLDVYEEESDIFYEDHSANLMKDDLLALLVSRPNVLLTSHQGFLTEEALENIARTTIENLDAFFSGAELENEVCYHCDSGKVIEDCRKLRTERCF